jgi:hypothetical protein
VLNGLRTKENELKNFYGHKSPCAMKQVIVLQLQDGNTGMETAE